MVRGSDNMVRGSDNVVRGSDNMVRGSDNMVHGSDNVVRGSDNMVRGSDNMVRGSDDMVRGSDNVQQKSKAVKVEMPMISSSSHTSVSSAPVEYDPMSYAPPTTHTIFRPASKKMGASLFDELDSFYLDLANLESVGAIPPSTDIEEQSEICPAEVPTAVVETPEVPSLLEPVTLEPEPIISAETTATETTRKKKKTKLAPGLSLKKKGVSSLVAKWQQVQKEVRRDFKNIDEERISSTHK
uniref:Uncharacterized protein n=1 Tax=Timema tahoe TaxID=61484 RepID=A0A7R9FJ28_9NEOP|nr:unnamed protein product [Timema tahoe]